MKINHKMTIISMVIIAMLFSNILPSTAANQPFKEIGRLVDIHQLELEQNLNSTKSNLTALSYSNMTPFENVTDRIAIIDTGISWDHPALSTINAVYWRNIYANNNDTRDFHGHGTQIAGLLASNGTLGAPKGLLPNAQYIILKGLNDQGETEDFILAQSIRTAADYGAKVIVLSLGIPVNSSTLKNAVDYAYQRNVLIVAAAGNHMSHVQFPAAYPNVLSVGSVNSHGRRSTFTPAGYELDVLAQGENVTVLQNSRGTKIASGTSMAAPLVAALALQSFSTNTNITVDEVISHIGFTSKNATNWNNQIGYGEVDHQQATNSTLLQALLRQNNTTPTRALPIARNGTISTRISNENQFRWYKVSAGYAGDLTVTYRNSVNRYVRLDVFDENLRLLSTRWLTSDKQNTTFRVAPEGTMIRISSDAANTPVTASFVFDYKIGTDAWETNNTVTQAKPIPLRSNIELTIHSANDQDWFYIDVEELGDLRIEVTNAPEHMDPVLMVRYGNFTTTIDNNAAGMGEIYTRSRLIGRYTFGVMDYNRNSIGYPYTVNVSFKPSVASRYIDIQHHWARRNIEQLYQSSMLQGAFSENRFYPNRFITRAEYASVIVSSLQLATPPTNVRAYRDINTTHWAHQAITTAKQYGLIQGYPDNTFRPDMPITRAEIATLTHNAYKSKLINATTNQFIDVPSNYWANQQISNLARNNILQGYPDGSFKPNFYTSRAEAVAIVSRLAN